MAGGNNTQFIEQTPFLMTKIPVAGEKTPLSVTKLSLAGKHGAWGMEEEAE
jgi:hypothetical protein